MFTHIRALAALPVLALAGQLHAEIVVTKAPVTLALTFTEEWGGFRLPGGSSPTITYGKTITEHDLPLGSDGRTDYYAERVTEVYENGERKTLVSTTDEHATTLHSSRFGNKELLQELADSGVIGNTSGWSLVVVARQDTASDASPAPVFFLEKAGETPINVSNYIGLLVHGEVNAVKAADLVVTKNKKQTETRSGSSSGLLYGEIEFKLPDGYAAVSGIFKQSSKFDAKLGVDVSMGLAGELIGATYVEVQDQPQLATLVTGGIKVGKFAQVADAGAYVFNN